MHTPDALHYERLAQAHRNNPDAAIFYAKLAELAHDRAYPPNQDRPHRRPNMRIIVCITVAAVALACGYGWGWL
jgi:hypothetical protein